MKKKIFLIVLLLFSFLLVRGQRAEVSEDVCANPLRSYGNDSPDPV